MQIRCLPKMNDQPTPRSYGSKQHYKVFFADILADIDPSLPGAPDRILEAFVESIQEWAEYHSFQLREYTNLHMKASERFKKCTSD